MKKKGFTLVEMLISIVIFSFIIALATYSFRFYASMVRKIIMPYPQTAVNFSYLNDAIDSIFYFVGQRKNPDIVDREDFFIYFYGKDKEVKFISSKPVYFKDNIAICRLYVDNNKNLTLEESPVYSPYNNYKNPTLISQKKKTIILLKNVSNIQLFYIIDGKKKTSLNEKIPSSIEMHITTDNKKMTLYFKIQSNFNNKLKLTRFYYAPL